MFGRPGGLYVYFTYGMHWCANLVCGPAGHASAVLLRAGEVVAGHETARARRPGIAERDLARGPARLTMTLALEGSHNGLDICGPVGGVTVRAPAPPVDPGLVRTGPRVGVSGHGGDGERYPWRFWLEGERTVSAYRPGKPRRRPAAT
jgi:DNA-3-methyladenine glycosylase